MPYGGGRREYRRSHNSRHTGREAQAALPPGPCGAGRRPRHDHPGAITEDRKSAGLDWITALRAPAIKVLLETGALQLSLFDQRDMASITAPG
jgi:hypothetical protein